MIFKIRDLFEGGPFGFGLLKSDGEDCPIILRMYRKWSRDEMGFLGSGPCDPSIPNGGKSGKENVKKSANFVFF